MAEHHSSHCCTEFMLRDALKNSAVMRLLLQGRRYPEHVTYTTEVEPPLDLSCSTGSLRSDEKKSVSDADWKHYSTERLSADNLSAKRKCVRCDFVAHDADTSYLHYKLHRKLLDQDAESCPRGAANDNDSSTLRTLLRRSDGYGRQVAPPAMTRHDYSSESEGRSIESTPSASPYHGYTNQISSPTTEVRLHNSRSLMSSPDYVCAVPDGQIVKNEKEERGVIDEGRKKVKEVGYCCVGAVSPSGRAVNFWHSMETDLANDIRNDIRASSTAPCHTVATSGDGASKLRLMRTVHDPGALYSLRQDATPKRKDGVVQCDLTSSGLDSPTSDALRRCQFCGITFDDDVMYSIHMGCHNHRDPFICNVCGKVCDNKYTFYTHIMRGHEYT